MEGGRLRDEADKELVLIDLSISEQDVSCLPLLDSNQKTRTDPQIGREEEFASDGF